MKSFQSTYLCNEACRVGARRWMKILCKWKNMKQAPYGSLSMKIEIYAAIYKVSHSYKAAIEYNRLVRQYLDRSSVFWLSSPCSFDFCCCCYCIFQIVACVCVLLRTDWFQSFCLLLSAESISSAVQATRFIVFFSSSHSHFECVFFYWRV